MQILLALLTGVLVAAGVYLLRRRDLLRMIFGLILLSNAVNLLVFGMGRVGRAAPPLIPEGALLPAAPYANPLPQALVLTALVIGFGLTAFALVLVYRTHLAFGTTAADALEAAPDEAPDEAPGDDPREPPAGRIAPRPASAAPVPAAFPLDVTEETCA